ncbi:restriction endonuclease subunit S [Peribacillus loiseleuriae]|uniref:restriction endonuclease subunit S n=1 Tax=Peribacillus loiseleuriae TaxID=1679170 RepID=UPI00381D29BE
MAEKDKKPEIRFNGFTNVWEQRRLSGISDKVIEKNANLEFTETFTNSAQFGIISQRDFFDHDISNIENLDGYYVVKNEDFVYNPRISTSAPVGPINRNKLGRNGVMSPLYTVFRTHDIDNTFLEQYFKSRYWHSYMKLNGDSGARSDRFSIKDSVFIEMPIPYPNLKEQLKIGEYLTKLDNLITLHQHKYDKLVIIKKSFLKKMFPKDGANVPEIRFAGFTDAWEQRKLGEIVEDNQIPIPKPEGEYTRLGIRSHARGTFHEKVPAGKGLDVDTMYVVEANNLIVNITFAWEQAVAITDNEDAGKLVSHRFPQYKFREGFAPYFLKYSMLDNEFKNKLGLASPGGAGRNRVLNKSEFLEIKRTIPKLFKEQKKIGEFFLCLDHLIILRQRELEKLKNIKKIMLEKMFV